VDLALGQGVGVLDAIVDSVGVAVWVAAIVLWGLERGHGLCWVFGLGSWFGFCFWLWSVFAVYFLFLLLVQFELLLFVLFQLFFELLFLFS
jgi:hypothetical protein